MAEINQFGSQGPSSYGGGLKCNDCEALLPDAMDGLLSPEMLEKFEKHLATCVDCAAAYADAKRGAAWLDMLKLDRPEPSGDLLARILAETSGTVTVPAMQPAFADGVVSTNVIPFNKKWSPMAGLRQMGHMMLQPRLAMTAAMAFFSIALTMNLVGVKVSDLSVSDLKPSNLRRSIYQTNAHIVRYYDNLRVVYELESRVKELQQHDDSTGDQNSQPANEKKNEQKEQRPKPSGGGSSTVHDPRGMVLTAEDRSPGARYFEDLTLATPSSAAERGWA